MLIIELNLNGRYRIDFPLGEGEILEEMNIILTFAPCSPLKLPLVLGLGDAAKLKPLEVELKRLEDLSESIVQDFAYMRQREVRIGQLANNRLRKNPGDVLAHWLCTRL